MDDPESYRSFAEFYPVYLREHSHRISRWLHFLGTTLGAGLVVAAIWLRVWWLAPLGILQGYAWAWTGHAFFEHNRPTTFRYPWLSFRGDWTMWWHMLTGRVPF
jgi:hypothetical protein